MAGYVAGAYATTDAFDSFCELHRKIFTIALFAIADTGASSGCPAAEAVAAKIQTAVNRTPGLQNLFETLREMQENFKVGAWEQLTDCDCPVCRRERGESAGSDLPTGRRPIPRASHRRRRP
jgi:hypothetical protein